MVQYRISSSRPISANPRISASSFGENTSRLDTPAPQCGQHDHDPASLTTIDQSPRGSTRLRTPKSGLSRKGRRSAVYWLYFRWSPFAVKGRFGRIGFGGHETSRRFCPSFNGERGVSGMLRVLAAAAITVGLLTGGAATAPAACAAGPYANCSEAKADGRCNIPRVDPDYRSKLETATASPASADSHPLDCRSCTLLTGTPNSGFTLVTAVA